ncbi:c-type heme family protein [Symmachiella dynata]|uniref:c-type heme family protein n=1 Tax=Symmachiella dynata TaxID=2527995 RepID=UPI0030EE5B8A
MKHLPELAVIAIIASVAIAMATTGHSRVAVAEEADATEQAAAPDKITQPETVGKVAKTGVSLEIARDRAEVMHDVYAATLEVLHERYFHGARAAVPARAMQDVFATIQHKSKVEARWISVNMEPMSIDHEPKSDFEKRAAQAISAGKVHLDVVEEGFYRRAGAIPLDDGCIGCHAGFAKKPNGDPKFAGLVISVPLSKQKPEHPKTQSDSPRQQ